MGWLHIPDVVSLLGSLCKGEIPKALPSGMRTPPTVGCVTVSDLLLRFSKSLKTGVCDAVPLSLVPRNTLTSVLGKLGKVCIPEAVPLSMKKAKK